MEIWFDKIRNKETFNDESDTALYEGGNDDDNNDNDNKNKKSNTISLIKLIQMINNNANGFPFAEAIVNGNIYNRCFTVEDSTLWLESMGIVASPEESITIITQLIQSEYVEKCILYIFYNYLFIFIMFL